MVRSHFAGDSEMPKGMSKESKYNIKGHLCQWVS